MRGLIFFMLVTLASLAHAEQPQVLIDVQHDASRSVTCYITPQGGISCLPDSQLRQQPAGNCKSSTCAKSQVSSPAPSQQDERIRL